MNNNNYGEMGSFCKSLKIEKAITYAFNNALLNWSISKEGLRGILSYAILLFQGGFWHTYVMLY